MECYECKNRHPGGTRLGIRQAVGVCHDCGVGLCSEHGTKIHEQPLLCSECYHNRIERAGGSTVPARLAG